MRINVDESALSEPRIRRIARRLRISHFEVLGRILHVWMLCYQRRTAIVDSVDVDIAAGDIDGFADAMLAEGLADHPPGAEEHPPGDREHPGVGMIYIRGVTERIGFLEKQAEKGRKSGESRRNHSTSNRSSTAAKKPAEQKREPQFNRGSADHRTYSPDLDLDLDLAPDQALDLDQAHENTNVGLERAPQVEPLRGPSAPIGKPTRKADAPSQEISGIAQDALGAAPGLRLVPDSGEAEKVAPGAAPELVEPARPAKPAPAQALTLAVLLMDYIRTNHPTSRLGKMPEKVRDSWAERWALTIDKMHRLDKHTWGEIDGMIHWSQQDRFWSGVILGADNLRDKWDRMAAQRTRKGGGRAPDVFSALDDAAAEATAREQGK